MKWILPLVMIGLGFSASCQSTALLLQKNGKTVSRYFAGQDIQFYTTDGARIAGNIDFITEDSIFMTSYQVAQRPTQMGGLLLDTVGKYPMRFQLDNIGGFPAKQRFMIWKSAAMVGGLGYAAINLINSGVKQESFFTADNLRNVGIATAVGLAGLIMVRKKSKLMEIGPKYTIAIR